MRRSLLSVFALVGAVFVTGCCSVQLPSAERLDKLFQARSELYVETVELRIANSRGDIESFGDEHASMDNIRKLYNAGQERYLATVDTLLHSIDGNKDPETYKETLDQQLKDVSAAATALKAQTDKVKYKQGRSAQVEIKDPWTAAGDAVSKTVVELWKEWQKQQDATRERVTTRLEKSKLPLYSNLPKE